MPAVTEPIVCHSLLSLCGTILYTFRAKESVAEVVHQHRGGRNVYVLPTQDARTLYKNLLKKGYTRW